MNACSDEKELAVVEPGNTILCTTSLLEPSLLENTDATDVEELRSGRQLPLCFRHRIFGKHQIGPVALAAHLLVNGISSFIVAVNLPAASKILEHSKKECVGRRLVPVRASFFGV